MKNILKKVMLIIYVTLAIILISTNYCLGVEINWIFRGNGSGYFCTTTGPNGGDIFCKEHGGKLSSRTLLSGLSEGDTLHEDDYICDDCNEYEHDYPQVHNGDVDVNTDYDDGTGGSSGGGSSISGPTVGLNGISQNLLQIGAAVRGTPWLPSGIPTPPAPPPTEDIFHTEAYTCEYEEYIEIDYTKWQEIAYILTFIEDRELVQSSVWLTDFNIGSKSCNAAHTDLAQLISTEGKEYKKYYETLQSNGFTCADKTDYSSLGTLVNTDNDTYSVGKFSIEYLEHFTNSEIEGECIEHWEDPTDTTKKFGYIYDMKLKDQNGNELTIVDIISADGESILSRQDYKYPHSLEEFYVEFEYDGVGDVTDVYLDIEFKYLKECQAKMFQLNGHRYKWYWEIQTTEDEHHESCYEPCPGCHAETDSNGVHDSHIIHDTDDCQDAYYFKLIKEENGEIQELFEVMYQDYGWLGYRANPIWEKARLITDINPVDITMDIGGMVFLDVPENKDTGLTNVNGLYDQGFDIPLQDIEVTLYEEDGTLATLTQETDEFGNITEIRTNPTLTDENGEYIFKGLNAQKKYYVTYKLSGVYSSDGKKHLVNGQHLESTMYTANVQEYNTDTWNRSSMASILDVDRDNYNAKFEHINSSPGNYTTINNITGFGLTQNKTYNIFEQTYEKAQKEYEDLMKLQTDIITKIRNHMNTKNDYPDDSEKTAIYQAVANENGSISEVENKIQYLVDIEVTAKTGHHSNVEPEKYPIYDNFIINPNEPASSVTLKGVEYKPIYPGQRHINLGTIEREKFDLKIAKDIYEIKITINGKEHIYKCNSRQDESVETEIRGSDVLFESTSGDRNNTTKHNAYERDLRESDIQFIDYVSRDPSRMLRVYVTYRTRITNQSNGNITGYVTQLNDYYSSDYTYLDSRVVEYDAAGIKSDNSLNWNDEGNNKLTTTGISGIALNVSEYFDIYTDFEVTTESILSLLETDKQNSTKENYVEIAGYKTYYTNQRTFNDGDVINEAGYVAGLVDRDSRPGDFEVTQEVRDFVEYSYTDRFKNKDGETRTKESLNIFQDDADKAPGLNLKLLTDRRILKGNVWEEKILEDILRDENTRMGDGINNDNQPIVNLKVQLIDMAGLIDSGLNSGMSSYSAYNVVTDIYNSTSKQFETAETFTKGDGSYEFQGYVPGDYLVRFIYGDQEIVTDPSGEKVYNGQDFKSTKHIESDHQELHYWYENTKGQKQSDAQDNLDRRNEINEKNNQLIYRGASVLDYAENEESDYLDELKDRAMLFADTEQLVMEVEYTEKEAEYVRDKYVTYEDYIVENVDFGIVERPRQELTITKDIDNIRIIANSGQTIFDAEHSVSNLAWIEPVKSLTGNYDRVIDKNGMIQATIDENLMHGATVKILYKISIENTGERDYLNADGTVNKDYYNNVRDSSGLKLVKTKADYIIDYVENNLKFNTDDQLDYIDTDKGYNKHWTWVIGEDNFGNKIDNLSTILTNDENSLINPDLDAQVRGYNAILKATDDSPLLEALEPAKRRAIHDDPENHPDTTGQIVETTLFLTKVLDTSDDSNDNFMYNNSLEIVQFSNASGRRHYNNMDKDRYVDDDQISDEKVITSIPGDYNPTNASSRAEETLADQPDYDYAERVTVLVPFGERNIILIIVASIVAVVVLGVGIVLIKRKVLNK